MAAVDGERDPRCLLLGFESIQELCCLYTEHDPEVSAADVSLCKDAESGLLHFVSRRPCPMKCPPSTWHNQQCLRQSSRIIAHTAVQPSETLCRALMLSWPQLAAAQAVWQPTGCWQALQARQTAHHKNLPEALFPAM